MVVVSRGGEAFFQTTTPIGKNERCVDGVVASWWRERLRQNDNS